MTPRVSPVVAPAGDVIGPDYQSATLTPFTGATVTFAPGAGPGTATILPTGQATATMYGQTVTLSPQVGPATLLDLPTPFAAVPCTPSPAVFTAAGSASTEFAVSGSAPLVTGGVLFPIVTLGSATPSTLPEPVDAWAVAVGLTAGLEVQLGGVPAPVRLAGAVLALTPTRLVALTALQGRARRRYRLWPTPSPPLILQSRATFPNLSLPQPQLVLDLPTGTSVGYTATPTAETVLARGVLDAVVDRPVAADGSRIALTGPALELRTLSSTGVAIAIGSPLSPKAVTSIALDTPNAIIPVGTPDGFSVMGTVDSDTISGKVEMLFPGVGRHPHPARPVCRPLRPEPAGEPITRVGALVTWSTVAPVSPAELSIEFFRAATSVLAPGVAARARRRPRPRPPRPRPHPSPPRPSGRHP